MEKFCKYCGSKLNEEDKFCQKCGAKVEESVISTNNNVTNSGVQNNNEQVSNTNSNPQNDAVNGKNGTNPSAIAGFVCSLVGLLIFGVIMGVIAICLGVTAKKHMEVFKNEKGGGLATAAIIIGIIDVVFSIIGSIFNVISIF